MDRDHLLKWFRRNRERSEQLFGMIDERCYYDRPIDLRNPIVFYEGHLPGFNLITLVKRGLGEQGVDPALEILFERGIDPEDRDAADRSQADAWPKREEVRRFNAAADELVERALRSGDIERCAPYVYTILEHEPMHHETLLYMFHQLDPSLKSKPRGYEAETGGAAPRQHSITVPAGEVTLGARPDGIPFGWDNEFVEHRVFVPEFEIDAHNVTNGELLEFVESGEFGRLTGREHPLFWRRRGDGWEWRGMFEWLPLPEAWPVFVTQEEAAAYAAWRGKRLMTEAEFHRAAYGSADGERPWPWGSEPPDPSRGNFDFQRWDPVPAGSRPKGASAWGIHDLVGNGWEWTSTVFAPFPGFQPMPSYPQYSADFFDGKHYVMKGGSSATASPLLRRSFRNWFRPNYPYVYATFRCVA
jgi:iron(II)-dependent oxidoreductase